MPPVLYVNRAGEALPFLVVVERPPRPIVGPLFSVILGRLTFTATMALEEITRDTQPRTTRRYNQLQIGELT
jgi:hypothetical protein